MIITKDTLVDYSCLRLVLRMTHTSSLSISLDQWISRLDSQLAWIPLSSQSEISKIILVLPDELNYVQLMEIITEEVAQVPILDWQDKKWEIIGVETENHDLYDFSFSLFPQSTLPNHCGRAVHAMILHWIQLSNPQLSEQLHEQENSPFTTSIQANKKKEYRVRVTLLNKTLLSPLLWGLSQELGIDVSLVKVTCQMGTKINWKKSNNFDYLRKLEADSSIQLRFLSPTSFKQKEVIQPFPFPELVFSSLWRKWNVIVPSNLELPLIEWQGMTTAYDLKTQAIQLKNRTEIGCVGWVNYQFKDPQQAQIATTLAHFAHFAGVGRKTAMGMGVVSKQ